VALTHTTAVRNALANLIDDQVNAGSPPGFFELMTAADAVLATIELETTAFGAASVGVITLAGTPLEDTSADDTGTAALFRLTNAAGTEILRGTVTATGGGGDVEIDNTSIVATQTVRLTSFTYAASA
jgi:hypothetical protein